MPKHHHQVNSGTRVKVTVEVRDAPTVPGTKGDLTNADTVAVRVILPGGEEMSPAPVPVDEPDVGMYSYEFDVDSGGQYMAEFRSTGPKSADVVVVMVPRTPFSDP